MKDEWNFGRQRGRGSIFGGGINIFGIWKYLWVQRPRGPGMKAYVLLVSNTSLSGAEFTVRVRKQWLMMILERQVKAMDDF